mmetsp:Transcript_14214/g.21678  ORF Transcript_14214/g.21678 Transcript_14214/m.21678 type:complete len:192 (-) Transcript_14214:334-909(-)|eukprot:CAMPEP_0178914362 /NCGR_PEP_ID=MMETSP0786-20121207/11384_1 /TAXON_ID=186022 /ORGANISM="Thalassionema frauenfeldii, Strain CCMP 1798" /LENGTH=191 /DNA_ID=CAMNT_0020587263 /DNA_START=107 /DNA_END=682 /DNA_ORIENTATION=+
MNLAERGECNNCEKNCGGFVAPDAQNCTFETLCVFCGHAYGQHKLICKPANPDSDLLEQIDELKATIDGLLKSNDRKVFCRLWSGDKTVHKLQAPSFDEFDQAVRKTYKFPEDEYLSYFVIKDEAKTREYIYNNKDLSDFFTLAGVPTIYVWHRGKLPSSSFSLPSQVELETNSTSSSDSSELFDIRTWEA